MSKDASTENVVIVGTIWRRRGKRIELLESSPSARKTTRPLRVARTLALAHVFRELIDSRIVRDQVELASLTGFTRARITQMLHPTLLAPDIQETLLLAALAPGQRSVAERDLRAANRCLLWPAQRASLHAASTQGLQNAGGEAQTMSA